MFSYKVLCVVFYKLINKDMKQYKLKEEVKKYFDENTSDKVYPLEYQCDNEICWEQLGVSLEALEEVEEKIELVIIYHNELRLQKTNHCKWTEQELKDLEWFLNEFGSKNNLIKNIHTFAKQYGYCNVKNYDFNVFKPFKYI